MPRFNRKVPQQKKLTILRLALVWPTISQWSTEPSGRAEIGKIKFVILVLLLVLN